MTKLHAQVVVCGGSLGGTIAAYSAAKSGKTVILLEQTDWIGGQLTSQAVPPDEHKWIESQGCTQSYRNYRNQVRRHYLNCEAFSQQLKQSGVFCPGGSEVSYIAHPPKLALQILQDMLAPYQQKGLLQVMLNAKLCSCNTCGDKILSVVVEVDGKTFCVEGQIFLDGTDTGLLLEKSGTDFVVGAESHSQTGEPSAPPQANPSDMQPITFTACLENRTKGDFVIQKPAEYNFFRNLKAPYDDNMVLSMFGPDSSTGKKKLFGMFEGESCNGEQLFPLFKYRRIVCADHFSDGSHPFDVSLVNWPQNDYFLGNIIGKDQQHHLYMAKQLTLSLVYWLQTEAPRADGGKGYRYFRLATEYLGTQDGLSKSPYVRESRRLQALSTITEQQVCNGQAMHFADSVGVGSYPVDLHITTSTHTFLYRPTQPFTIPLSAMVPQTTQNLLPACKNIGTTHLTNGCYRLHPVEWNIGEVAGLLAAFLLDENTCAKQVCKDSALFEKFAQLLQDNGIQRYWQF